MSHCASKFKNVRDCCVRNLFYYTFCWVQRRYYQPHTPNGAKKAENRWLKNEQNTKAKNIATGTQAISNGGHRCEWPCWRPTNKNNIVLFWCCRSLLVWVFSITFLFSLGSFFAELFASSPSCASSFLLSSSHQPTDQPSKHTLTCTSICTHARTNWIDQAKFAVDRPIVQPTIQSTTTIICLDWRKNSKAICKTFMFFYGASRIRFNLNVCMCVKVNHFFDLFCCISGVKT